VCVCDINTIHGANESFLCLILILVRNERFCVLLERLAELGFLVVEVIFRFHLVTELSMFVRN